MTQAARPDYHEVMADQELTEKLLALPITDRVDLAQALWQSIDEEPAAEISLEERQAVKLARQRDMELATGSVVGRSHHQVLEAARRALGCD